ncbi:hypothetical protein [Amnibacterium kyonggiense]
MVPVRVLGLAVDAVGQPVVLLTPLDGDEPRTLVPIWVGAQEAASIGVAVSGRRRRARSPTTSCAACSTPSAPPSTGST